MDLIVENYKNLLTVKNTLQNAFSSVLAMKVANINNTTSTDHVENILNGYFDLLLYHSPVEIFDTESNSKTFGGSSVIYLIFKSDTSACQTFIFPIC